MAASRLMRTGLGIVLLAGLLCFAGSGVASADSTTPPGQESAGASSSAVGSGFIGPPDPGNPCRPQC